MDVDRQYIIDNFAKALKEKWITVYYQPIVRAVNGRVCDEEALARWNDPEKGFLSPADFIPILEEEKLIYKLDLYVLEQVLEKIKFMKSKGYFEVSQSINLSRSDFDVCDIVEEICSRIDKAGVERSRINIEITESTLSDNFKFMRSQIERLKNLGFCVWMDDFGSGYSSLDVLQRIPFDLLKFDMSFMHQLGKSKNSQIILTELMRMAYSLGVDTICEGVETQEQVDFLHEIGCSKLQGFYYGRPIPVEQILERYKAGNQIGFEMPEESYYSELIGRINLHDLSVISDGDKDGFSNFFNSLPMAIVEIDSETIRYIRANQSYTEFMERYFFIKQQRTDVPLKEVMQGDGAAFIMILKQVAKNKKRIFVDEKLPEGSMAHYFVGHLAENPVNKRSALVVTVLSITASTQDMNYANIARALAADYFNLFYVNLENEDYIEYTSNVGEVEISTERHGTDFFKDIHGAVYENIFEDDVHLFLNSFTKENIIKVIDEQGTFVLTYRLLKNGVPNYVCMKVMRMPHDKNHIIIGISNVDAQMRQKELLEQSRQNEILYTRLMALSGDYICIYVIDPKTNTYIEHNTSDDFMSLKFRQQGVDFFEDTQLNADTAVSPEDREAFKKYHTKENILKSIEKDGVFTSRHNLLINGEQVPVALRCVLIKENGEDKLIMGIRKV